MIKTNGLLIFQMNTLINLPLLPQILANLLLPIKVKSLQMMEYIGQYKKQC